MYGDSWTKVRASPFSWSESCDLVTSLTLDCGSSSASWWHRAERVVSQCGERYFFEMFWLFGIGVVVVAALGAQVPKTGFSCDGRTTGYYADVESGCQAYHMCDGLGRQFTYTCPNATLFQQRMLICDHWYMVNCSRSVEDYKANLRIGHREMPFVDDNESNPYHRTPRPDLLAHHSQSEYDIIYRTGRKQNLNNLNVVGAESDSKNVTTSTTDQPAYSLPSHWSTEYNQDNSTPKVNTKSGGLKKNFDGTVKGKPVVNINSVTDSPVNYKSYYKATTPVFPLTVDQTSPAPGDLGLLPPLPYNKQHNTTNTETSEVQVNYQSQFQATTPAFPSAVDVISEEPADVGLLPPQDTPNSESDVPSLNLEFEPPAVDPNPVNRTHEHIEPSPPSKFYQPPKFQPDYTELPQDANKNSNVKARNSEEWKELRNKFLIPDYEFPLESVSRPSYDTLFNSFQGRFLDRKKTDAKVKF